MPLVDTDILAREVVAREGGGQACKVAAVSGEFGSGMGESSRGAIHVYAHQRSMLLQCCSERTLSMF